MVDTHINFIHTYESLRFLIHFISDDADADVRLNPALREMEYEPHVKCSFRYTESTLHNPKTSILFYGILCGKGRIRHIAFQTIPLLVLGNLSPR